MYRRSTEPIEFGKDGKPYYVRGAAQVDGESKVHRRTSVGVSRFFLGLQVVCQDDHVTQLVIDLDDLAVMDRTTSSPGCECLIFVFDDQGGQLRIEPTSFGLVRDLLVTVALLPIDEAPVEVGLSFFGSRRMASVKSSIALSRSGLLISVYAKPRL